jgi:hypothetical protein
MFAAKGGHLEMLQWPRANSCPWSANTCLGAARGGRLEVLQWLRANGCPRNEKSMFFTARNGHEAIVRALIEAGADVNKAMDDGATPLCIAAQFDNETIVRVLIVLARTSARRWITA